MENLSHNYLTSGEFASLMQVSKETLFHYDELGIFSPELRGENNYRQYSIYQIEAFEVIRSLKEIGVPLKEIKKYLNSRSASGLIALLERESQNLQNKISKLTKINSAIKKKAELTRSAMNIKFDEITIDKCKTELLAVTFLGPVSSERAMMLRLAEHFNLLEKHRIQSPFAVGEILPVENARRASCNFADYFCFYSRIKNEISGLNMLRKPAGDYLTAYHFGGYSDVYKAYARLLEHADKNALSLCEHIYEDLVLDELSTSGYDEYVFRLSVKIKNE